MNKLKEEFLNTELVKRIHSLEKYIDNNEELNSKLKELKKLQKKMVNAKEFNQINQYKEYENKEGKMEKDGEMYRVARNEERRDGEKINCFAVNRFTGRLRRCNAFLNKEEFLQSRMPRKGRKKITCLCK